MILFKQSHKTQPNIFTLTFRLVGWFVGCVAQLATWRNAGLWPAYRQTYPALGLQPIRVSGDHVRKPFATGQPTRPTQPFILSRSINE